jgi:hypothetical protein
MLQHQINNIIKKEQLGQLTRVDLSVGGEHGGEKFQMTLKVMFEFDEQRIVSCLFQTTSVSCSKDDIEILQKTVLDPIGESLQRVSEGGGG